MKRNAESADEFAMDRDVTTYDYTNDVSCSALAQKYEEEGNYQKAIEYYQKAYKDGDE